MENLAKLKEEIIETGKRLYNKGFVPGTSGNISIKHNDQILITPSGINLGELEFDDIVTIDSAGNFISGRGRQSSEYKLHVEIYKKRPDVSSVIHAHCPKATAFAVAGIDLNQPIIAEAVVMLGEIPVAEYATPSSDKLAIDTAKYFADHDCVLLANHGVAVAGKKLKDVYYKLETVELYAEIYLWSKLLGKSNILSDEKP